MDGRPWCWRCFAIGVIAFATLGWWAIYRSDVSAEKLGALVIESATAAMASVPAAESADAQLRGSKLHISGRVETPEESIAAFSAAMAATEGSHGFPGVFSEYVNEIEVVPSPTPAPEPEVVPTPLDPPVADPSVADLSVAAPSVAVPPEPERIVAVQLGAQECQAEFKRLLQLEKIEFESGEAVVSSGSYKLLQKLADVAKQCNRFDIEIGGHTDPRGSENYNLQLSRERAEAVLEYLGSQGVDTAGLVAVGYGEGFLLDSSDSSEGLARNRRIEITVASEQ